MLEYLRVGLLSVRSIFGNGKCLSWLLFNLLSVKAVDEDYCGLVENAALHLLES